MKIAIVHEWLTSHAGSEKVVEQILQIFPEADVFSLVDFLPEPMRGFLLGKSVHTSFIQNLPWAKEAFRQYLALMPLAVEQFDLSGYDLVISSSHAVAKGALTRADQLHISYVHTPIRYAWDLQQQYLQQAGLTRGIKGGITRLILHYLRVWDAIAAHRVDAYIANSRFIARRIWKTYRRPAQVIYPPVAVDRFRWDQPRQDFYLCISRFVPYKRVDLVVEAFNHLGLPLVIVGDGPAWPDLHARAKAHIQFLGYQPDAQIEALMERCKAFIYPAEEDFGITLVEAQAAGAPVIAYGRGGATETVIPGKTGLLFPEQTAASLIQAVVSFEKTATTFQPALLRQHAEHFSNNRFQTEFRTYVEKTWAHFQRGDALE